MSNAVITVKQSDGRVTVENDVCVWGLLELPRRVTAAERTKSVTAVHNDGEWYVAKAVCKSKQDKWQPKEVLLNLDPGTVFAIYSALA
jgi:hypothetical protein